MEFDEMRKIWDTQNNEPLYVINEKALHRKIESKKRSAAHITNVSELVSIIVNFAAGGFLLASTVNGSGNVYLYVLAAWMFITSLSTLWGRVRRIRGEHKFDRTMLGDLDHAISTARYQVQLSGLIRWNVFPIGALIALGLWSGGRPLGFSIALIVFFLIVFYLSGWEHRFYQSRKREVEALRDMLIREDARSN